VAQNEENKVVTGIKLGVFGGMLGGFALDLYNTLNVYGMDKRTSHKIAMDYMSELGAAMKTDIPLRATVGSIKDGKSGFKAAALKFNKNRELHYCSAIAKVLYTLEGLYEAPVSLITARPQISTIAFKANVKEYIAESDEWAKRQNWLADGARNSVASIPNDAEPVAA